SRDGLCADHRRFRAASRPQRRVETMATAIASDGVRLHYETTGEGTPIVFVHEFAGNLRSWEPQVRHFARQYQCIRFNARGYPPSEVPESASAYSQAQAVRDIVAVMDAAGVSRA